MAQQVEAFKIPSGKGFRKLHTLSKMAALLHTYLRRINGDRWLEMCVQ